MLLFSAGDILLALSILNQRKRNVPLKVLMLNPKLTNVVTLKLCYRCTCISVYCLDMFPFEI